MTSVSDFRFQISDRQHFLNYIRYITRKNFAGSPNVFYYLSENITDLLRTQEENNEYTYDLWFL